MSELETTYTFTTTSISERLHSELNMGKLHLKRTPEEERAHDLHKARKAARKAAKRSRENEIEDDIPGPSAKRHRATEDEPLFQSECPYESSHRAHKPDYDYFYAQAEENRFHEKMWGAFEDDDRLDSVEARFNSYTHIPRRWRGGGMDKMDDESNIDPQVMEEEDYAEWVRDNMWRCDYSEYAKHARYQRAEYRRTHAAEHAEQERKNAERAARKEQERKIREETARMEKAEAERRKQKRHEAEHKMWADARMKYETAWKALLAGELDHDLRFEDIPWPVFAKDVGPSPDKKGKGRAIRLDVEDLTLDAIAMFLIPGGRPAESTSTDSNTIKKERRDKLRETMLRFHPDKFEGRIMPNVVEADKQRVQDAVGKVARMINDLLASKSH